MKPQQSSADLIRSIQTRDSKYRVAFVILMFMVLLVLAGVVLLQARTIDQFKEQSAERSAGLKALQEKNLQASGRTNAYLQCIARFFAERDRTDLQLTDLDACAYERDGITVPGVDVTPTTSVTVTPSPVASENNSATTPERGSSNSPSTPPSTSPNTPSVPTTPPVLQVEPVTLCVPLTQLCVVL